MTVTMDANYTDEQLVVRTREGDISAFEAIVERYRAAVVACAYSKTGSLADAEDVAQEAFVQAFFHLTELRDPRALPAWLRKMTERFALMHIRSRREIPVAPGDLELHTHDCTGTDIIDTDCLLSQLPEAMRETVSLTFLAGYTCAEAACILGVKEGTVKSRLNRARAILREVFDLTDRNIAGGLSGDFTRRTIERLKREARRLVSEGKVDQAGKIANDILREQIKPLLGDPDKLGVAQALAAYDSPAFWPDHEAVAMLGLPHKERRRRECEANAAQYGFTLEELDWEVADVDVWSETLAKPTGFGKDTWGVPVSRMNLDIIDARALCQRLKLSPLILYHWVLSGCPVLRCWPWARFDSDRVNQWLQSNNINGWPTEDEYNLERPIRVIFREVYAGCISTEQAEEIMHCLGDGVWEAPIPITGGW